jgi:hypothetical protein
MAHFAKLGVGNIVQDIQVVSDVVAATEQDGIDFLKNLYKNSDTEWRETFKNASQRKNFAGIGYHYNMTHDAFIPPQPYPSWTLNEATCLWDPPVAYPDDGKRYNWNEATQAWDEMV